MYKLKQVATFMIQNVLRDNSKPFSNEELIIGTFASLLVLAILIIGTTGLIKLIQ